MIDKKIEQEEIERLKPHFDNIEVEKKALAEDLIHQAGFMKAVLSSLQKEIEENGMVDEYKNGANQTGLKVSATIQSYNQVMKNYVSVNKQLQSFLPKNKLPNGKEEDELLNALGVK